MRPTGVFLNDRLSSSRQTSSQVKNRPAPWRPVRERRRWRVVAWDMKQAVRRAAAAIVPNVGTFRGRENLA